MEAIPPISSSTHDLQAEQSVLGAIFIKAECLDEIHFLEPRDFLQYRHQKLYEVMKYLYDRDRPVDLVTVTEHYNRRGKLDDVGGIGYLMDMANSVPTTANVAYYAKIVRSKAIRRRGIDTAEKIKRLADEDFETDEDYFTAVEELTDEMRPQKVSAMRNFKESKDDYYKHLKSKAEKMVSGFHQFDKWAQLWRGWLYIIAGRPSVGKTAKALQLAYGTAKQEREHDMLMRTFKDAGVVLIYSQEMGENEIKDRMVSNIASVSYDRLINKGGPNGFTEAEWKKIDEAYAEVEELPIYVQDSSGVTIDEIRATARRFMKTHGKIAAIIVDYLQIMSIPEKKGQTRAQAIGYVTRTAKNMARNMKFCFILLSQMTRESENREEPKLSDLKESGNIEQDADVVEFLWYNPKSQEQGKKIVDSFFAKGRNVGINRFKYEFQWWYQRYIEVDEKAVKAGGGKTDSK